jgi:hypothetical protein
MSARSRVVAACAAVSLAPVAAACTSAAAQPKAHSVSVSSSSASSSLVAKRWWSNSAALAGSVIDVKRPEAVAARLHQSKADYCGMLRQTVGAGRSILQGVTANDPALVISTKAFVAEIEATAPSAMAGSWKVLGPVVLTIVESGGDTTKVKGIDAAAVRKAASTVAAHAKHSCGVDLASVRH